MNPIEPWLQRKLRIATAQDLLLAALAFGLGMLVLAATYFFTYAVVWLGINFGASALWQLVASHNLHITHREILLVCTFFVGFLFVGNARTSREYLSNYTVNHPADPGLIEGTGLAGSLSALLANPDASAKLITDILYTGPRLVVGAWQACGRSNRRRQMDVAGLAQALMILRESPGWVARENLAGQLAGFDADQVLFQLQGVDGVVFIETQPPAFKLSEDLRLELLAC